MKLAEPLTLALWFAVATPLTAQSTRPERTGYRETSSYDDVLGFLDSLQTMNRELRIGTLGISSEGRPIPYVVAARPGVLTPVEAHRSGKPVIYLQADIHGGEVEGKEAAQMLLRDLTAGPLGKLLEKIILLVVPIYNPDGNERWAPAER